MKKYLFILCVSSSWLVQASEVAIESINRLFTKGYEDIIDNGDGSKTLINPFVIVRGQKRYLGQMQSIEYYRVFYVIESDDTRVPLDDLSSGICKFFSLGRSVAQPITEDSKDQFFGQVSRSGHFQGVGNIKDPKWEGGKVDGDLAAPQYQEFQLVQYTGVTCAPKGERK